MNFEVSPAAVHTLPSDYMSVKGVLPFGFIANEMLVCVMNGVDPSLREEIEAMSGRKCHFFLMHPRAWFDQQGQDLSRHHADQVGGAATCTSGGGGFGARLNGAEYEALSSEPELEPHAGLQYFGSLALAVEDKTQPAAFALDLPQHNLATVDPHHARAIRSQAQA